MTYDIYLASAGCGKTSRLMNVVDEALKDGYSLSDIAFVTFTRKGAEVAKQRVCEAQGISLNQAKKFSTIHSMCFHAINANKSLMMDKAKYQDFADKAGYQFGNLNEMNTSEGVDWRDVKDSQLINTLHLYRNNKAYYDKVASPYVDNGRFVQFISLYTQYKKTFGYLDFTDLLDIYLKQGKYSDAKVVCIDEAQDCSLLQWHVLFEAFRNAEHIHIAGDVKQSIYCFAGADPQMLLKMKGIQHMLDMSYRVPSNLLSFAQSIADLLSESDHMVCKTTREGGVLKQLISMEEFTPFYKTDKSILMLCRNRRHFTRYTDWCEVHALPYKICGDPVFTDADKIAFRTKIIEGKDSPYDTWPEHKQLFALDCYKAGTFFGEPNINISTIHSVKGDEADIVVLLSDISKLVSKGMDLDEDAEHRVFYVGVTRAKEELYIIAPQTKTYYPYILG